jgi:two-component system, OmpR family, response regulator RegX3
VSETLVVGIVEDDEVQREIFVAMLAGAGLRTLCFSSVAAFRRGGGHESIDVLLLDWNLPGVSGIDLLKGLRDQTRSRLPVILLTANADERDIVYGLQCGADDYVVKPPRRAELVARIRAAHRRGHAGDAAGALGDTGPFEFDLRERRVRLDGVAVRLTEREFDLCVYLFGRVDRIVSRQMLLSEVWRLPADANTRSVDTYVSRLRKRLGLDGQNGWRLEGVYQHGYRLARSAAA